MFCKINTRFYTQECKVGCFCINSIHLLLNVTLQRKNESKIQIERNTSIGKGVKPLILVHPSN